MFKLFKRSISRDNSYEQSPTADNGTGNDSGSGSGSGSGAARDKRHSLHSTTSFCDALLESDEDPAADRNSVGSLSVCSASLSASFGGVATDEDIFNYHSRLSMTLTSIVSDRNCLGYFVQYLEVRNGLALIKFYLDTENFKAAALAQLQDTDALQCARPVELERAAAQAAHKTPLPGTAAGESGVPELKTLCDLSMAKPLTDDEKSEIYAETNKQLTKCTTHTQRSERALEPAAECACSAGRRISSASIGDAMAIYRKYLIADAKQFVRLPVGILSEISLLLCQSDVGGAPTALQISADCFDGAQQHVLEQLERDYLTDFLQSTFYCRYCVELIEGTSGDDRLTIYDVLFSEVTLFFFMEFLEQHGERNCLDFWSTAINYRQSGARNEAELQADAMIIYEKFFSLQADCRLWMSDKLRSAVEERICAPGQVAYSFDLPLQIVAKYLEKKYFRDFLSSQLFENYLNELKTKIHEELTIGTLPADSAAVMRPPTAAAPHSGRHSLKRPKKLTRHRKTLSDCSNEATGDLFKHISQQNTLLAMDSAASTHLRHLRSSGTSLSIDSRHLTDPNLLWHRAAASSEGGLKFGRISALGRYERDFDTMDAVGSTGGAAADAVGATKQHSWSLSAGGNKLKNAMRKLVNLPEDKVQEEIAWQVAEMIIKDVTNVTLHGASVNGAN